MEIPSETIKWDIKPMHTTRQRNARTRFAQRGPSDLKGEGLKNPRPQILAKMVVLSRDWILTKLSGADG